MIARRKTALKASKLAQQAEAILAEGFHLSAAMTARAALETAAQQFWRQHAPNTKGLPSTRDYLDSLCGCGAIQRNELLALRSAWHRGTRASHNTWITPDEAQETVQAVQQFVNTVRLAELERRQQNRRRAAVEV